MDVLIRVRVTSEHIARGVRRSARNCAVALATYEALMTEGPLRDTYAVEARNLAPEVLAFMQAFDAGSDVQPFEFDLPESEIRWGTGVPEWRAL
jgi:hypothetical protein